MNAQANGSTKVGIDDLSYYIPELYLPIATLAEARDLEFAKLNKGLGLKAMAVPDAGEDAATMAANAVVDLLEKNQIDPRSVGRLYLGTESGFDGAKPMASYVLDMLTAHFSEAYGPDCFLHCDVVDLTFACIGAVDALQNTLDWVRSGPGRQGIVVASDVARYELGSGGEYTQGAGAIALLVRNNPRLLAIQENWGVAARPVYDFFKPVQKVSKQQVVEEVLRLAGLENLDAQTLLEQLSDSFDTTGVLDSNDEDLTLHRETPVFDGPYSNNCYQQRIREALRHFTVAAGLPDTEPVTDRWARLVFHLPYAFQARRMFSEIFREESLRRGDWQLQSAELQAEKPDLADFQQEHDYRKAYAQYLRAITKTKAFRRFVNDKIERGERASSLVGNLYTASVFLSLISTLESDFREGGEMRGKRIGFFAYGSGSKSKVFEGEVQAGWRAVIGRLHLFEELDNRRALDYETYERLHRGSQKEAVSQRCGRFFLQSVETENPNFAGARTYARTATVSLQPE